MFRSLFRVGKSLAVGRTLAPKTLRFDSLRTRFPSNHLFLTRTYCKDHKHDTNTPPTSTHSKPATTTTETLPESKPTVITNPDGSRKVVINVPYTAKDIEIGDVKLSLNVEPRKHIEFECANCNTHVKKTCSTHAYERGNNKYSSFAIKVAIC